MTSRDELAEKYLEKMLEQFPNVVEDKREFIKVIFIRGYDAGFQHAVELFKIEAKESPFSEWKPKQIVDWLEECAKEGK